MKKINLLAFFLSLTLLFQTAVLPASAEGEATQPSEQTGNASVQVGFGSESIVNGCRTIEGMVPLGGSERRLASVFSYSIQKPTRLYTPITRI